MSSFRRAAKPPAAAAVPAAAAASSNAPASGAAAPAAPVSFAVPAPVVPGTRRAADGTLVMSAGSRAFDDALGGGYIAGSCNELQTDARFTHARTLVQLFLAEGLACKHKLVVIAPDVEAARALVTTLPMNVSSSSADVAALADRDPTAPPAAGAAADLKIASGYAKYLGDATASASSSASSSRKVSAHTFDLNRSVPPETLAAANVVLFAGGADDIAWDAVFHQLDCDGPSVAVRVAWVLGAAGSGGGGRASAYASVHMAATGAAAAPVSAAACGMFGVDGVDPELTAGAAHASAAAGHALAGHLLRLRRAIAATKAPCVGVVAVPGSCAQQPGYRLVTSSLYDTSVCVKCFSDPPLLGAPDAGALVRGLCNPVTAPEFADYHGTLTVRKTTRPGTIAPYCPDTRVFVFMRDRRRMRIEKPHLPPEGEGSAAAAAAGSSASAGGAAAPRAAATAAMPCSSAGGGGGGGGAARLDF